MRALWPALLAALTACPSPPQRTERPGLAPSASPVLPSASAPETPARPPATTVDAGTPALFTGRVEIPGLVWLGEFVPGQAPSAGRPNGTVIATGGDADDRFLGLVEIDLATGTEVRRRSIGVPAVGLLIRRDGELVHIAAQDEHTLVWLTYDLAMDEQRRVTIPAMGKDRVHRLHAFGVRDGHAILVDIDDRSFDTEAHVFDVRGHRIAHHDCAPLAAVAFAVDLELEYTKDLAVILGVYDRPGLRPSLCAFRPDGQGPTLRAPAPGGFYYDGAVYSGDEPSAVRELGRDLRPTGPLVRDPREHVPRERCRTTGEYIAQDEWISEVEVIHTGSCCGGEPGGFFLCR